MLSRERVNKLLKSLVWSHWDWKAVSNFPTDADMSVYKIHMLTCHQPFKEAISSLAISLSDCKASTWKIVIIEVRTMLHFLKKERTKRKVYAKIVCKEIRNTGFYTVQRKNLLVQI